MGFTYDASKLSTSTLYQVRNIIGDVMDTDFFLDDNEIDFALDSVAGDVNMAALTCCDTIVARLARKSDYRLGPYSINAEQQYKHYTQLAYKLRKSLMALNAPINAATSVGGRGAIFDIDMMRYSDCEHPLEDED